MHFTRFSFLRHSALVLALAVAGGCTDFSDAPDQLGRLTVSAKDESGAPVAGIKFTAFLADRTTAWAVVTTGADGTAEFRETDGGILPQTYIVRFDATTPGYTLADGEPTEKPVTVLVGHTHDLSFTVKKSGPGGNPG